MFSQDVNLVTEGVVDCVVQGSGGGRLCMLGLGTGILAKIYKYGDDCCLEKWLQLLNWCID